MWHSKHILLLSIVVVVGTTPLHCKFCPGHHCKILVDGINVHISMLDGSPNSKMFNPTLGRMIYNNAANPPPTLEQVLMMQAQILQTMQQIMVNMQNAQPQAPPPPPRDKLGDFQCTKPPTFSHSVEPMDVDDWLMTVEKKLQVVQCNNREKVLLASHQLTGPAADWWDAYVEAHIEPDTINWNEFKMAFRSHHIPQGIIKLKKKEFP
jgi:hypothetical protein